MVGRRAPEWAVVVNGTDELDDHPPRDKSVVQSPCKIQVGRSPVSASLRGTLAGHHTVRHAQKMALQQGSEHR